MFISVMTWMSESDDYASGSRAIFLYAYLM